MAGIFGIQVFSTLQFAMSMLLLYVPEILTTGVHVLGVLAGRLPGVFMQEGHEGGLLQHIRVQDHLQIHVQRQLSGEPDAAWALVTLLLLERMSLEISCRQAELVKLYRNDKLPSHV